MVVEPLNRLSLRAASVADDLGFVALGDLARALGGDDEPRYRVIGGQMMTVLAARWGLGADLYRVTLDADLGTSPVVIRDHAFVERLVELGYQQVAGDRFAKAVYDIPAGGEADIQEAVIDILLPAYSSRPAQHRRAGDLVVTEALGLAAALQRPPVAMELALLRLNGALLEVDLSFPDEPSALVLKAFATQARHTATDHTDVWRCLEIAHTAGITPDDITGSNEMADGADIVRSLFSDRHGPGMTALADDQRLSEAAADQRYTRIRALIDEVLGA